jgi:flagellar biosynthesis protein FlhA
MAVTDAMHIYTLLTIGDGLVTQIPGLADFHTATGLVVPRAASEANLGQDIARQLFRTPKALYITATVLIALAFLDCRNCLLLPWAY